MQDSRVEQAQDEELWAYDEDDVGRSGLLGSHGAAWLFAPLLALLVGVGGFGAHLLLEEIPEETVAAGEVAAEVTCWDGQVRPADDCGEPTGRLGLRWVFPSFRPTDQGCTNLVAKNPKLDRPTMFECTPRLDGTPVTVVYSEVRGVEKARRYLERRYGGEPKVIAADDGDPGWWRWRESAPRRDGEFGVEQMYAEHPFSVEVLADTPETRDRALDELVRWRPPAQVSIRPDRG